MPGLRNKDRWIGREGGGRREQRKRGVSYDAVLRGLISHRQFSYATHTRTVKVMPGRGQAGSMLVKSE